MISFHLPLPSFSSGKLLDKCSKFLKTLSFLSQRLPLRSWRLAAPQLHEGGNKENATKRQVAIDMKRAAKPLLFTRLLLIILGKNRYNLMTMVLIPLLHFGVDVIGSTVALGAALSLLILVGHRRH